MSRVLRSDGAASAARLGSFVLHRGGLGFQADAAREADNDFAPRGFGALVEELVLFVRNDIAIANIGHETGAKYAPLIMTFFFLILFCNLLGLIPFGASPTGNLAVTGALALISLLTIEIGGMLKLGFKGYMGTIFPHIPGLHGVGGLVMTVAMAPIEIPATQSGSISASCRAW